MSKVNIRFVYQGQQENPTKEVISTKTIQKGPIIQNNPNERFTSPSFHSINMNENIHENNQRIQQNGISIERQIPSVPSVQIISKPTSPKFSQNRLKSPEGVTSQKAFMNELKTNKVERTQSPRPVIKNIEEANEIQLVKKTQSSKKPVQKEIQQQIPQGQIILKSPSFKFIPKQDGDLNAGNRKQYVRAEKAEKYLYNGIPQKSEDDFVGCFGCFQKKPKAYKVTK